MSLASSSSFQRHGQRDDRRRRLLTDELCNSDEPAAQPDWPERELQRPKSEHYGDAEFLGQQWRLLDLVPRRLLVLGPLLTLMGAAIGGLVAAYSWMCEHAAAGGSRFAALEIDAKGSLACWLSSLMLLAAAFVAILIYSVRRHRTDDYQGRYRVWLWAAGYWLLLATDQAASLREAFQATMIAITGTPLLGDGTLWWVAGYVLIFVAVGSRLLIDMWPSRLSLAAMLAAIAAFLLAMVGRMGWVFLGEGAQAVMCQAGIEMAAQLLLLSAMAIHARCVLLDAEGLLPVKVQPKEKAAPAEPVKEAVVANDRKDTAPSTETGRWTKIDPPHTASRSADQRPATTSASSVASAEPSRTAEPPAPLSRKLNKAERKAMKERLLRERTGRERDW
ncbi:MAG: hypothetical protein LLG00_06880 [Planctomycetaceae bacterium]|nr:hypothetical protein [Planctomycetaceae bacterium]